MSWKKVNWKMTESRRFRIFSEGSRGVGKKREISIIAISTRRSRIGG